MALGRKPDYLSDNSESKWGKSFFGIECVSPENIKECGDGLLVVITVRQYEPIYEQLKRLGVQNVQLMSFDRGFSYIANLSELPLPQVVTSKPLNFKHLVGKWALVTGASRGVGFQVATALAEVGINIVAHSRKQEHNFEVINACEKSGVQTLSIGAELADIPNLEDILRQLPDIDILINCAGISGASETIWQVNYKDYVNTYTVNTVVPIIISNYFIPKMLKRGYGRVINVSSTIQHRPYEMAYACSKAALDKYVNDIVPSLGEEANVKMCLVDPGWVRTDMGGELASHDVDSVLPGAILGVVMDDYKNGRWFSAQDYTGYDLQSAVAKAKWLELNSAC